MLFNAINARLAEVKRFDRLVGTKDIQVGEVENAGGGTELAVNLPDGGAVTLEDRAKSQLLGQWKIPPEHFDKLPRALQVAELNHFKDAEPKTLTFRAVGEPGTESAAARAVVSGRYEAFDTLDALKIAQEALEKSGREWRIGRDGVDRDEMSLLLLQPTSYDVSKRKVGDMVNIGLSLRNSEVGTMALGVEFAIQRLRCLNGMIVKDAVVTVKQRHIWVDRKSFEIQLKNAIQNVSEIGEVVIQQIIASHDLLLPNLDPDAGKVQREVVSILRKHGMATKEFIASATQVLGKDEEASVFGLVQYITDKPAKALDTGGRLSYERVAGELMALARAA